MEALVLRHSLYHTDTLTVSNYIFFSKVATARKFDAEKFVNEYLEDYHTPLTPGTYQGKRLPQWLIKVSPSPTVKVPSPKVALNGA
jgi:hypothetical protein